MSSNDLTARAALDIAAAYAFEFSHTPETRAAQEKLWTELQRGNWAPRWKRQFKAALELLDALN